VIVFALAAFVVIFAVVSWDRRQVASPAVDLAPAAAPTPAPAAMPTVASDYTPPTGTIHEIQMIGDEQGYRFAPANLTIRPGDAVRFVAVSGFPHNVSFDPLTLSAQVKRQLDANFGAHRMAELTSNMYMSYGDGATISFANIPPGIYAFFCTPHLAMGMQGIITVAESDEADFSNPAPGSFPNADYGIVKGAPPTVDIGDDDPEMILVERFSYDISRRLTYSSRPLEQGVPYLIRVSGRGGVGPLDSRNYQNSKPDAAFSFCGDFQDLNSCQVPITGNSRWPNNWDGLGNRRPSPDVYRPDHVYDFIVLGQNRSLQWFFEDNPYSDNQGDFRIEIYRLRARDANSENTGSAGGDAANVDQPYFDFQVEKPVGAVRGSAGPRYPDILRSGGIEGQVLAQFVVDTTGSVEVASFRVIRSDHAMFEAAVRSALPNMRFLPAEIGGRKVRQLVQQPFTFALQR